MIQALQLVEVEELEAVVVVGSSNPHYETLEIAVQSSRVSIRLQRNVTNMPELMAWADVAISAAGSTCWELAFMGLPSILLILAENQRAIAQELENRGHFVNLGWHETFKTENTTTVIQKILITSDVRAGISKYLQELVDGQGVFRLIHHLTKPLLKRDDLSDVGLK